RLVRTRSSDILIYDAHDLPSTCASSTLTCFFSNHPATTEIYTLSLHDALPISIGQQIFEALKIHEGLGKTEGTKRAIELLNRPRSEEHTSELQSRFDLVCRLLLEKKKKKKETRQTHTTLNTSDYESTMTFECRP